MPDENSVKKLLQDTRSLLNFHRHCGLDYPLSGEIKRFLTQAPPILPHSPLPPKKKAAAAINLSPPAPPPITMEELKEEFARCRRCPERQENGPVFFGEGKLTQPDLCIITSPPSLEEVASGQAISGDSRELLVKMLAAINLRLEDVFLTNITKCACRNEQNLQPDETAACLPLLTRQLELINPKVICAMGQIAARTLLKTTAPLASLRGRFKTMNGIPLMATFHPALLLKNPELKKGSWQDLQLIQKKLAAQSGGK